MVSGYGDLILKPDIESRRKQNRKAHTETWPHLVPAEEEDAPRTSTHQSLAFSFVVFFWLADINQDIYLGST